MFSSIRTRLTLWYVGVLALIIAAFASATYFFVARNLSQVTDSNLDEIGRSVETDLHKEEVDLNAERHLAAAPAEDGEDEKKPADEDEEQPLTIEAAIAEEMEDLRSRDYGFLVLDGRGQIVGSTIDFPALRERAMSDVPADVSFADLSIVEQNYRVNQRKLTLDGKPFRLIVTCSTLEQSNFLAGLLRIFSAAIPIALLLAGLGGYFLARRSLAPVVSMSNQAGEIGSSNLNQRLAVKNESDELGNLAKTFNSLLSRIESSFNQQRQFMADASHELRTPVAILRGESQIAISKGDRTAAEYRESLAVVHDESRRLSKIVEDLFVTARADSGQLRPVLASVFLDEIVAECVRAVGSLAEKRMVKIEFFAAGEMPFDGDEPLLHRLFLNLLDNAIKYNRREGRVIVKAEILGGKYAFTVADDGDGIPEADRPRIFDRFYRADKSRTSDNADGKNGVGLGLSIAAWIAEGHGGSVILESSGPHGSIFRVELPG